MVVDDFHVERMPRGPDETEAEPAVDAKTVLALAVSPERFQPITRQRGKVPQLPSLVQLQRFPARRTLDGVEPARRVVAEQLLRFAVAERADHPDG